MPRSMRTAAALAVVISSLGFGNCAHAGNCDAATLVQLTLQSGELRGTTDWPRVAVHEDGCVALRRPVWYRQSGDYTLQLDARELAQFAAITTRVAQRDWRIANARRDDAQRELSLRAAQGEPVLLSATEGADLSRFEFGHAPAFAWRGLEQDASRFDQIGELIELRDTQRALVALLYDPRAKNVAEIQP